MDYEEWRARPKKPPAARRARKGWTQGPLFTLPDETPVLARLKQLAPLARALVDGALRNRDVGDNIRGYPELWSEEKQRRHPTVRVEFEHTIVIGHIGESVAAGDGKAWGPLLGVFPLEEDDPVHPYRLLYLFKDTSPYQQRFDQRKAMKARLGKGFSRLVNRAMGSTLGGFLPALTATDVVTIQERLGVTPSQFWRAAKGRAVLALPTQRPLFVVTEE